MTIVVKAVLFLSSFAPLCLLLGIRFGADPPRALALGGFGLLSAAAGLGLVKWIRLGQEDLFVIDHVENRGESLTGYLVGYLFPFLVLDPSDRYAVIATIAFFVLLAVVYVQTNLLYLNPVLALFGWRLWFVAAHRADDVTDIREIMLITKGSTLEIGAKVVSHAMGAGARIGTVVVDA